MSPELTPVVLAILFIAVFWFLLIRPQRNQQRTQAALQQSLQVGDEVVISAGVFGTVTALEETRVHLEVAPGTVLRVARQVVVRKVEQETPGVVEETPAVVDAAPSEDTAADPEVAAAGPDVEEQAAPGASVTKAPAKKAPAKKTAAKKAAAKKTAAKKVPAKKVPAKKSAADAVQTPDAVDSTLGEETPPAPESAVADTADTADTAGAAGAESAVNLEQPTDEARDADRG